LDFQQTATLCNLPAVDLGPFPIGKSGADHIHQARHGRARWSLIFLGFMVKSTQVNINRNYVKSIKRFEHQQAKL
jgi:hypothetical protein